MPRSSWDHRGWVQVDVTWIAPVTLGSRSLRIDISQQGTMDETEHIVISSMTFTYFYQTQYGWWWVTYSYFDVEASLAFPEVEVQNQQGKDETGRYSEICSTFMFWNWESTFELLQHVDLKGPRGSSTTWRNAQMVTGITSGWKKSRKIRSSLTCWIRWNSIRPCRTNRFLALLRSLIPTFHSEMWGWTSLKSLMMSSNYNRNMLLPTFTTKQSAKSNGIAHFTQLLTQTCASWWAWQVVIFVSTVRRAMALDGLLQEHFWPWQHLSGNVAKQTQLFEALLGNLPPHTVPPIIIPSVEKKPKTRRHFGFGLPERRFISSNSPDSSTKTQLLGWETWNHLVAGWWDHLCYQK